MEVKRRLTVVVDVINERPCILGDICKQYDRGACDDAVSVMWQAVDFIHNNLMPMVGPCRESSL
jgi:hypothetical protein